MKRALSIALSILLVSSAMVFVMPTCAEASSRTCAVSGCDRKCDSGSYCRLHKCAEPGCKSKKGDNGTIYCNTHAAKYAREAGYKICSASGCYGRASGSGSYCYDHTCIKSGCNSKRVSGSNYCSAHSPSKASTTTKSSKSYSSTSKKSKKTYHDSYDDGYDSIYEDGDYDWDRYWKDDDYARGVDDAMEDFYEDFGDDW